MCCGPDGGRGACDNERQHDHCCRGQRGRCRGVCQRSACLGCVLGVNFVLSLPALVVGIVFAGLLGVRGRESVLALYNDASAKWPAAARAFRDLTAGSGGFLNVTGDGGTLRLLPYYSFVDNYPDAEGLNVPSRADAFKYFGYNSGQAPVAPRIGFSDGDAVSLDLAVNGVHSGATAPVFRATAVNVGKQSGPGVVKSICIVVDPATSGAAGACNYDKDKKISVSAFESAGSGPWNFDGTSLPISVRSTEDPYYVLL